MSLPRFQTLAGFLIALTLWLITRHTAAAIAVGITVTFAVIAWLAPKRFAPIQHLVDRLVRAIVITMSWVALALVYFAVFTPVRLWRTVIRRDALRLRRDPHATTYLTPSPKPSPFTRQF